MGVLTVMLLLWCLVEPTWTVNSEYNVIPIEADWESAQKVCLLNEQLLMPDFDMDVLQSMISHEIQTDKVLWVNAKSVEIVYPGQPVYLKFGYQATDSKLTSYLCHNAKTREIKKYNDHEPASWKTAQKVCNASPKWSLYNVSTPKQVKGTVSLLQKDVTYWVDKISKQKIPSMVSDKLKMEEECIGVMKLFDGSLGYRRDNCSNKHRYVCVPSAEKFAPTITKLSEPFLFVSEEPPSINDNITLKAGETGQDSSASTSDDELGGVIGGSLACVVIVILVAAVAAYYLRRRWRSRRDYRKSLQRYTQKRMLDNSLSVSLPMNSCYMENEDSMKIVEPDLEGYEECEKRSYAQCQKDVVQNMKSRYSKYPSKSSSLEQAKYHTQDANVELKNLPAYHSMDVKKKGLQVLPAYESYDPDLGHLQQIHGYVNKKNQPQLSDLEQYDNIPKLPRKSGKQNALYELEQYENHNAGNQEIVGKKVVSKPLADTDRNTITSLEELEQYENYKVPKREKGLFQMFKANQAKQAAEEARRKANAKPNTLDDLEQYETVEPQNKTPRVNKLEDLDAYENYAVKKY